MEYTHVLVFQEMKALPTTSATSLKMIIEDSEREGEGVGGL
jgi:hypothetical protein